MEPVTKRIRSEEINEHDSKQEIVREESSSVYQIAPHVTAIIRHDFDSLEPKMTELSKVLSSLGADECWHKHGTFKEHLMQVWRVLALWKQPQDVCRLGLFHSTYSNSFVNLALLSPNADRGILRDLIGDDAEDLVHHFCIINRQELVFERCLKEGRVPAEGITMQHIRTGEPVHLSQSLVGTFLLLTIADYTDQWYGWQDNLLGNEDGLMQYKEQNAQSLWPGSSRPGLWMSAMSRLGRLVADCNLSAVPPIFENCTAILEAENEVKARDLYWQAANGERHDIKAAARDLEKAIELNPFAGEFHIVLAHCYLIESKFVEALAQAYNGIDLLVQWGTSYDKRMDWAAWIAWARVLVIHGKNQTWPTNAWGIINLGKVDISKK